MLCEASLTSKINKTNTNRFVLKSFLGITHLLVKQNWAHTHNFKNVVDLVAECGGKELQTHLLTASKKALYILPDSVAEYIDIMNEYMSASLLASLRTGKYTLYNEETRDISSTKQMSIYAAFEHMNCISEHYLGILPISELVGSHLSAPNIFGALNKYLREMNISWSDGRFFCMVITNVNSGKQSGLKRLFKHAVPWVTGCLWKSQGSPLLQAPVE